MGKFLILLVSASFLACGGSQEMGLSEQQCVNIVCEGADGARLTAPDECQCTCSSSIPGQGLNMTFQDLHPEQVQTARANWLAARLKSCGY